MSNSIYRSLFAAIGLGLFSAPAYAHHGSNGQFDTSKEISATGVFTQIKMVNPHAYIYFDVTTDAGEVENWRCEMSSGSALKRLGWSSDVFEKGVTITATGNPAWREPTGCKLNSLAFENGTVIESRHDFTNEEAVTASKTRVLTLADGTPNIFGNWNRAPRVRTPAPTGGGGAMGSGMGGGGMGGPPAAFVEVTPTAAGRAANEGWVIEDLPRLDCKPVNIFHDWWFDGHVNTIAEERNGDITLRYGFMDLVRTVHMDMDAHPENLTPSVAGHSIGRWDGHALVVDTTGFAPGYILDIPGIKHSDQLETTERFTLSEDGKTLIRDYEGSDPLFLEDRFKSRDEMITTNASFDSYECDDLTQEVVKGGFSAGAPDGAVANVAADAGPGAEAAVSENSVRGKMWLWILAALLTAGIVTYFTRRRNT